MMIYKRLFENLSGKCVVSVLHRLYLLRMFDFVYVFKEGKIVEEGTFKELSNANGNLLVFGRIFSQKKIRPSKTSKSKPQ